MLIYSANTLLMDARRGSIHARRIIYPVLITIYLVLTRRFPVLMRRLHENIIRFPVLTGCLQKIIARLSARRCRIQEKTTTVGVFIGYEDGINSLQRWQYSFFIFQNIFLPQCTSCCGGLILNCLAQLFAGLGIKTKKQSSSRYKIAAAHVSNLHHHCRPP